MALGDAFSPITAQQEASDPRLRKRRTPVQQALQSVQLQMPSYTGGQQNALTSRLLAGQAGAGATQAAQPTAPGQQATPGLRTMLNALTGAGTSSTSGFAGGGFGAGGPVAGAGGATTRPTPKPAGPRPGPKPPGGMKPPGLPGLPGNIPGKVKDVISGLPGGGGGFKLPPGLKPPKLPSMKPPKKPFEAPEPGDKNWNPNIPGMGMLDTSVSKPPVVFGGGGPSFTTPTGGAGGGFGGGPVSGGAPGNVPYAPQSQPAPGGVGYTTQQAANRGGVYHTPTGEPRAFGPSGPPPGATGVQWY